MSARLSPSSYIPKPDIRTRMHAPPDARKSVPPPLPSARPKFCIADPKVKLPWGREGKKDDPAKGEKSVLRCFLSFSPPSSSIRPKRALSVCERGNFF